MKETSIPVKIDTDYRTPDVLGVRLDKTQGESDRVLLVSMPFGGIERPALSLGLLQAYCQRLNIPCDTRYFTFSFAERVGLSNYLWLCSNDVPYTAFAGDWLFTEALYGRRPYADAAYVDEVLRRTWQFNDSDLARLLWIRGQVEPFLDHCLEALSWSDYTFVGFTSVFQQNIASLALSARLKNKYPDITIAFGGANWEEEMGIGLLEQFPFVDLAFSGEADESFPAVLEARRKGNGVQGIRGVSAGARSRLAEFTPATGVLDLDSVPIPDFGPFFEQKRSNPAIAGLSTTMLMETARGCWWGDHSHCTFCGLNGAKLAYRSKTPTRVITEIELLYERYAVETFSIVDDILDMHYFHTVLPRLAEINHGLDFFWEVKANLSRDQVRQLRAAGVRSIQPGIESLNDHVLKLMRKGTNTFLNIELLKWCCEYDVKPSWNLLYGFPGETAEDYAEILALIPYIWHLEPPTGYGPIRLDRFSPFHADPGGFGMTNLRPLAPFTYLYPFERQKLMEITYYFDFDYIDRRRDDTYAQKTIELIQSWKADSARGMLEMKHEADGTLHILDTRRKFAMEPRQAMLKGWKASVYLACDTAKTLDKLVQLPEIQHEDITEDELLTFLNRCEHNQLMIHVGQKWLGVAVHKPARDSDMAL